jgi:hypothetical protein
MIGIDGSSIFLKILDSSPKLRRIFVDASDLHRVLGLECEYNIALLRCIDLQSDAVNHQATGFLLIAKKLEHGALEAAVGLGDKSQKFLASLKSIEFTDSPSLSEEHEPSVAQKKYGCSEKT